MQGHPDRPDAQAAAAFGLTPEQAYGPEAFQDAEGYELWAEHVPVVSLFQRMRGQWRMGFGGPVALDYGALPVVARLMRMRPRRLRECFEWLRVMEAAALEWVAEQQASET